MAKKPNYFFSIVIPTLNEEKYLPRLLKDLSTQTLDNFEVIVVDGNSEDKTELEAKKFSKQLSLSLINVNKRNVSFQRNTGEKQATADWVIFMDADNRLPTYYLEGIRYQLNKHPETDFFTTWTSMETDSKIDKVMQNATNLTIELYNIMGIAQGTGALLGFKKELFNKHSFDETQHYLEDGMLIKELCDAGYTFKIFREPKFVYSLRRIKKEGNFKSITTIISYQLKYLLGGDFSKPYSAKKYPMLGGQYYDQNLTESNSTRVLGNIQKFIKTASKKQLEQARHILNVLKEM